MCVRLWPHYFLSTSYFFAHESFFVAHESHESSRIHCLYYNGDLFGRTNHTNSMIELIELVKFVRFVGKKNNSWIKKIMST